MGKQYLVKQEDRASLSNILNEMFYEEKMTLQELRFFLVYLSRINPKEPDKTAVTFSLEEYAELLGVELNEAAIKRVTRKLLRYVVCIRPKVLDEDLLEDYRFCQLFSESRMYRRKFDGRWFFDFACHERVKEHLFELKGEYTSMEVWNILNLNNFQDARMYMLLKQYRKIGERTIPLDELKKMLCIDVKAYPEYKIFARDVLKKCQQSLQERTDISFDFKAVGRPARAVKFTIRANSVYTPPKFLADSAAPAPDDQIPSQTDISQFEDDVWGRFREEEEEYMDPREANYTGTYFTDLARAVDFQFSQSQLEELNSYLVQNRPNGNSEEYLRDLVAAYAIMKNKRGRFTCSEFAYVRGILKKTGLKE